MGGVEGSLDNLANATYGEVLNVLRVALSTALALVPDDGPWVLGYSLHPGNILLRNLPNPKSPTGFVKVSALNFTGHVIILENPKDPMSVQKAIQMAMESLQVNSFSEYTERPEFPLVIRQALDSFYAQPEINGKINPAIHTIRVMSLYSILNSLYGFTAFKDEKRKDWLDKILRNIPKLPDQKSIEKFINSGTAPGYINIDVFKNAKGGKRKTRRQKPKKNKKRKQTRK